MHSMNRQLSSLHVLKSIVDGDKTKRLFVHFFQFCSRLFRISSISRQSISNGDLICHRVLFDEIVFAGNRKRQKECVEPNRTFDWLDEIIFSFSVKKMWHQNQTAKKIFIALTEKSIATQNDFVATFNLIYTQNV